MSGMNQYDTEWIDMNMLETERIVMMNESLLSVVIGMICNEWKSYAILGKK